MMVRMHSLAGRWRDDAAVLRRWGDERGAVLLEAVAGELEAAVRDFEGEVLTLDEAARESGYSVDLLGRMVREGKLENAGRPGAPRIRRADLPLKPAKARGRKSKPLGYNAEGLFQSIATSKYGG